MWQKGTNMSAKRTILGILLNLFTTNAKYIDVHPYGV